MTHTPLAKGEPLVSDERIDKVAINALGSYGTFTFFDAKKLMRDVRDQYELERVAAPAVTLTSAIAATIKAALENCPGILPNRRAALDWVQAQQQGGEANDDWQFAHAPAPEEEPPDPPDDWDEDNDDDKPHYEEADRMLAIVQRPAAEAGA